MLLPVCNRQRIPLLENGPNQDLALAIGFGSDGLFFVHGEGLLFPVDLSPGDRLVEQTETLLARFGSSPFTSIQSGVTS